MSYGNYNLGAGKGYDQVQVDNATFLLVMAIFDKWRQGPWFKGMGEGFSHSTGVQFETLAREMIHEACRTQFTSTLAQVGAGHKDTHCPSCGTNNGDGFIGCNNEACTENRRWE